MGKRWLQGFLGISVDDPETVADLKSQIDVFTDQRDEASLQRDAYRDRVEELEERLGEALMEGEGARDADRE